MWYIDKKVEDQNCPNYEAEDRAMDHTTEKSMLQRCFHSEYSQIDESQFTSRYNCEWRLMLGIECTC